VVEAPGSFDLLKLVKYLRFLMKPGSTPYIKRFRRQ
jgi:hypothetical protein